MYVCMYKPKKSDRELMLNVKKASWCDQSTLYLQLRIYYEMCATYESQPAPALAFKSVKVPYHYIQRYFTEGTVSMQQ